MTVFCISDSLGLPRPDVSYEETWYYMLIKKYPEIDFYPFFLRDLTTDSLEDIYCKYVRYFSPKCVLVQLGICDCSPRIINKNKLFWKLYLWVFKKIGKEHIGWRIIKRFYHRDNPQRVVVPLSQFRENHKRFLELCIKDGIKLLYVKIATPSKNLQNKSKYMKNNIDEYNSYLDNLAADHPNDIMVVSPLQEGNDDDYVDDGYHTNKTGAQKVFFAISKSLEDKLFISAVE